MTDRQAPIGFLGFGEAGFHVARGLRKAGAPPLIAFDIKANDPAAGERIRSRASETATSLVATPQALADGCGIILSLVTASSALDAARSVSGSLSPDQFYVELNSVSPATKRQIGDVIGGGAGRVVEAAIKLPVPPSEQSVPILL